MDTERLYAALARLIPIRAKIALGSLALGILLTVVSFYLHDLWLALVGAVPLGGALGLLLIPLPHPR
ncbi:MAG TPA: hypothetical protein VFG78_00625 [Gemmatimonadota bacterium]|nr:hypothetical protein [Gemmatimonadota bacterium]